MMKHECPKLQVLWVGKDDVVSASWVHQASLSTEVIELYEKGVEVAVRVHKYCQGRQVNGTANVEHEKAEAAPSAKRPRIDRWIAPSTSGYSYSQAMNSYLTLFNFTIVQPISIVALSDITSVIRWSLFCSALSDGGHDMDLQCNTEKDRQTKLNHHTAGMS